MSILEHPIMLAPMAGFGTAELAAAVADAGGLGSIGCATMNPHFAVASGFRSFIWPSSAASQDVRWSKNEAGRSLRPHPLSRRKRTEIERGVLFDELAAR